MKNCKCVMIIAGHGLSSSGAIDNWATSNGVTEREITKSICSKLFSRLVDILEDSDIHLIFIWKENEKLTTKIDLVNNICKQQWYTSENSLLLSVHVNAWWWTGIETFTYKDWEEWLWYWNKILLNLNDATWLKIRWAKYEWSSQYSQLWIVHDTIPLAILVETWFIDNDNDRKILTKREDEVVDWLLNGLSDICDFTVDFHNNNNLDQVNNKLQIENLELKAKLEEIQKIIEK